MPLLQQVQLSVVAVAQRCLVHAARELRRHLGAQLLLQRRGLDGLVRSQPLLLLPPRRLPLQGLHAQPLRRGLLALGGALFVCWVLLFVVRFG